MFGQLKAASNKPFRLLPFPISHPNPPHPDVVQTKESNCHTDRLIAVKRKNRVDSEPGFHHQWPLAKNPAFLPTKQISNTLSRIDADNDDWETTPTHTVPGRFIPSPQRHK